MRPLCVSTDIIILGALQLPLRVDTEEHLQRLDQGHGSLCLLPETYYWVYVSSNLFTFKFGTQFNVEAPGCGTSAVQGPTHPGVQLQ